MKIQNNINQLQEQTQARKPLPEKKNEPIMASDEFRSSSKDKESGVKQYFKRLVGYPLYGAFVGGVKGTAVSDDMCDKIGEQANKARFVRNSMALGLLGIGGRMVSKTAFALAGGVIGGAVGLGAAIIGLD
ncbi:MAG: hypothetical protein ACLFQV_02030 [Vulcanimicrobiota bacterium]